MGKNGARRPPDGRRIRKNYAITVGERSKFGRVYFDFLAFVINFRWVTEVCYFRADVVTDELYYRQEFASSGSWKGTKMKVPKGSTDKQQRNRRTSASKVIAISSVRTSEGGIIQFWD